MLEIQVDASLVGHGLSGWETTEDGTGYQTVCRRYGLSVYTSDRPVFSVRHAWDGNPMCVAIGTHWEQNLATAVSEHGATITPVEIGMGEAFMNGECDAISSDWSLLLAQGIVTGLIGDEDAPAIIVGGIFSSMADGKEAGREPFAIAVSLDDMLFRDEVDAALLGVVDDGTWQTLYDQWFPAPSPWNIEEILPMPPAEY